jgi:acylphosphatase
MERATVYVRGRVQGVGFRWWTRAQALELGLVGYARNLPDGGVEVVAQGAGDAVDELIGRLQESPSTRQRPGSVTGVVTQWTPARPEVEGFEAR